MLTQLINPSSGKRGRSLERSEKNAYLGKIDISSNQSPSPIRRSRQKSSQELQHQRFAQVETEQSFYGDEQVEHVNLQNSVSFEFKGYQILKNRKK